MKTFFTPLSTGCKLDIEKNHTKWLSFYLCVFITRFLCNRVLKLRSRRVQLTTTNIPEATCVIRAGAQPRAYPELFLPWDRPPCHHTLRGGRFKVYSLEPLLQYSIFFLNDQCVFAETTFVYLASNIKKKYRESYVINNLESIPSEEWTESRWHSGFICRLFLWLVSIGALESFRKPVLNAYCSLMQRLYFSKSRNLLLRLSLTSFNAIFNKRTKRYIFVIYMINKSNKK